MLVECPSCGCRFVINHGGPKPKIENNLQKLMEIIRDVSSIKQAAIKLNCGEATIYRKLKSIGIDPKSITGRKYTKRSKNEN